MGYELMLGSRIVGVLGKDNTIQYDEGQMRATIKEIIAGQNGQSSGSFTSARVIYRWDRNRKTNNDAVWNMWKANPIIQNRITQLNALTFGRGLKWIYDEETQAIIDRFWRVNRLRSKLNAISTDAQLYGEVFIGLFPQPTGDVKIGIYESNQVEVDFNAGNVYDIIKYIITYKDEATGKDEVIEMTPIENYLNEIEYSQSVIGRARPRKGNLGLNGIGKLKGNRGVMLHIKFNNSTSEVYGTSDFKQVFDILPDYMNFVGDRLTIHQIYGSPAWDITIDTDDPNVIMNRINELAGFQIGSNPVHNASETWKPLQFNNGGSAQTDGDEKVMRGLLCAGTGFPEHLLFNQMSRQGDDDNTFSVIKLAEDRQDAYTDAFTDIHKFVVAIGGGDPTMVDQGQIIFPEINTMSEKSKAETYVLKVGAQICSRRTAAVNMGYSWAVEEPQIIEEEQVFGQLLGTNSDMAGAVGGRFTTRVNNQDPERDDGTDDRKARATAANITTQVMGNRKENN